MNARMLRTLVLTFALAVVAAPALTAHAAGKQKEIRVEEGTDNDDSEKLQVLFKATKTVFAVDEPITFKIKSNKQVYVYVFNMNEDQQKAVQIFPNKYDKANLLKPGKTVTMPSKKSIFRSDTAGTEHLILVASEKKLNLQHTEPTEGSFYNTEWKAFKAIRVEAGDNDSASRKGKFVKELDIVIKSN